MHKVWTKIIASISLSGGVLAATIGLGAWSNSSSVGITKSLIHPAPTNKREAIGKMPTNTQNKTEFKSFIKKCNGLKEGYSIESIATSGKEMYAGMKGLLYHSYDGENFTEVPITGIPTGDGSSILSITINGNQVYVAALWDEAARGGFFASSDGKNFTKVTDIPTDIFVRNVTIINDKQIYVGTGKIDHKINSQGLWLGTYSDTGQTNGSFTFEQLNGIPSDAQINNVTINGKYVCVGTADNGLYVSDDNISRKKFHQAYDIPNDAHVKNVTIHDNKIYVWTSNQGLWIGSYSNSGRSNGSFTFNQPPSLSKYAITNVTFHNNKTYVGTDSNGLYISSDHETTFSKSKVTSIYGSANIHNVIFHDNQVYVSSEGSKLGYSFYVSYDDGTTFSPVLDIPASVTINKIITVDNQVYVGTQNEGLYISTDAGKTFHKAPNISTITVEDIIQTINHTVYVLTSKGLFFGFKGKNGQTFLQAPFPSSMLITAPISNIIFNNNRVYIETFDEGLCYFPQPVGWESLPDYIIDRTNNSWVYGQSQTISLPSNFISGACLDGKEEKPGATDILLKAGDGDGYTNGHHTLTVALEQIKPYASYAPFFGGDDRTGTITYDVWVKTSVDGSEVIPTTDSDTILVTGLSSITGNTKGNPIIQTKTNGTQNPSQGALNLNITNKMIDYSINKSYYVEGTVNSSNDFTPDESTKQSLTPSTTIQKDGVYHLVLTDYIGKTYEAYLALGESVWALTDKNSEFNDDNTTLLKKLADKLKITYDFTGKSWSEKYEFSGWLNGYRGFIHDKFEKIVAEDGKGFAISEPWTKVIAPYLKGLTYLDPKHPDYSKGIADINKFHDGMSEYIKEQVKVQREAVLAKLPKNLQVHIENDMDKITLDKYAKWINDYDKYINTNYYQLAYKAVVEVSLGYAPINAKIAQFIYASYKDKDGNSTGINYFENNFLKAVDWNPKLDHNFSKYIDSDREMKWLSGKVEAKFHVKEELNEDIKAARKVAGLLDSDKYYHAVMSYKKASPPKNKGEVDNFDQSGKTFAEWLILAKADYDAHSSNTNKAKTIGMAVGITIAGIIVLAVAGWIFYTRYNKKDNFVGTKKSAGKK